MHTMHEDVFYNYFRPYRHPNTTTDIWGGIGLETYGQDFELAKSIDDQYIWTVIDGDKDQIIITGLHSVNRICYLITEISHANKDFEFRISSKSLTDIGLKREIKKLQKYMDQ